jgi:hypothetical protein
MRWRGLADVRLIKVLREFWVIAGQPCSEVFGRSRRAGRGVDVGVDLLPFDDPCDSKQQQAEPFDDQNSKKMA